MCIHGEVEVFVKDDVASAVAPAADVDRNADGGGMAGRILDVDAHDGVLSAHTLGAQADGIDAVLEELFHLGRVGVVIVGADGAHQGFLGIEGRGLDGGPDADADQERRTGVETIGRHAIQDEFGDAFVAFTGHEDGRVAGKGAAAAGHVGVDLALIGVGDDVPPDSRCALADVLAGVVLVKGLDGIVAKGCVDGRLHDGFLEQDLEIINVGEPGAALDPELEDAGVLAGGAAELDSQFLVAEHGLVDGLGHGIGLFFAELLELCDDVVRQLDAGEAHELGHDILQFLELCFV